MPIISADRFCAAVTDGHETDYEYEGSDNEEEKLYKGEPR